MNSYDHVFHTLEVKGIEVIFDVNSISLNFPTGLVIDYKISDFGRVENLAKFIAHEQGIKFYG